MCSHACHSFSITVVVHLSTGYCTHGSRVSCQLYRTRGFFLHREGRRVFPDCGMLLHLVVEVPEEPGHAAVGLGLGHPLVGLVLSLALLLEVPPEPLVGHVVVLVECLAREGVKVDGVGALEVVRQLEQLEALLAQLPERNRQMLELRYGLKNGGKTMSYLEVGEIMEISRERVRQIEITSLKKMRLKLYGKTFP